LGLQAVLGVGSLFWIAVPAYRQLAAIREIERLQGSVTTDTNRASNLRHWVGWDAMRSLDEVIAVDLHGTHVTNNDLATVQRLGSVCILDLGTTRITDDGLEQLQGLTNLRVLFLNKTQVTDAGLKHLKGLPNLKELSLYGTQVTQRGIADLRAAAPELKIHHWPR
jgi:hypothetical protein